MSQSASAFGLVEKTFVVDRLGRDLPIYSIQPATTSRLPALILVHEIFGVNHHIRSVAQRFAAHSMRVFAPDLFATSAAFPQDPKQREDLQTMREVWSGIADSDLIANIQSVFDLIASQENVIPQKIGVIGYCMGGAIGLMLACTEPRLAWAVDYYGRIKYGALSNMKPKHPLEFVPTLKCPLLGIFAGKDELIPEQDINELSEILQGNKKSFQLKVYPNVEHAFFNDERQHYNSEAAHDAWQLTLGFIGNQIRTNEQKV